MKRRALIGYLDKQGCEPVAKAEIIPGGVIATATVDPLSPAMSKSMTYW